MRRHCRERSRVTPEDLGQGNPHARGHSRRVELAELEPLVVAAHLHGRLPRQAELGQEPGHELVELQPALLASPEERWFVERAHERQRTGGGLASRCPLQEGVDQVGQLVRPRPCPDEELLDLERLASRPAGDELVEQVLRVRLTTRATPSGGA